MATYSSAQAASTYPLFLPESGHVAYAKGVYEIAAALSANDLVNMCKIPAGCEIIGGWLRCDDLDTGTEALELDVGYQVSGSFSATLLDSGVLDGDAIAGTKPEVGIQTSLFGALKDGPIALTADTTVQVKVTAAANAGGTGTLTLVVLYGRSVSVGT